MSIEAVEVLVIVEIPFILTGPLDVDVGAVHSTNDTEEACKTVACFLSLSALSVTCNPVEVLFYEAHTSKARKGYKNVRHRLQCQIHRADSVANCGLTEVFCISQGLKQTS